MVLGFLPEEHDINSTQEKSEKPCWVSQTDAVIVFRFLLLLLTTVVL